MLFPEIEYIARSSNIILCTNNLEYLLKFGGGVGQWPTKKKYFTKSLSILNILSYDKTALKIAGSLVNIS